jgi:hypothetical protein
MQADRVMQNLNSPQSQIPAIKQDIKLLDRSIKNLEAALVQMEKEPARFKV